MTKGKTLTPTEAAALAFAAIQHLRATFDEEKQMTVTTAATLLAALANPDSNQSDITVTVGGLTAGGMSKQLDLLEGRFADSTRPRLIYKARNEVNRKQNDVIVNEDGKKFTADLAKRINHLLKQWGYL